MKPNYLLSLVLCSLFFAPLFSNEGEVKPNIIFILTDDQSFGYMGVSGNKLAQTPHLDQLASEGIFFRNAHITSAICTPSRVSMFLSQFERKHGVNFNSGTSVTPEAWENSYPVQLKEAGYYTGYVGKNHAPVGKGGYESGLMEASFDYWYAGHGHLRFYPGEQHEIFKGASVTTQAEVLQEGVLDFLQDNAYNLDGALHFLDQRPRDRPFCLSLCFNLPHGAGVSTMQQRESDPEIYKSLFRDLELPLPEHYLARSEIEVPKLPEFVHHASDRQTGYDYVDTPETLRERTIRTMQAMTGIDRLVGNLRERLKSLQLDSNTLIVFTSDHGLLFGQYGLGGKALCYEICTHVPMIFYDPILLERNRDVNTEALVQSIDIAPTLLERAGVKIPASYQGKSLVDLLLGRVTSVRDYLYTENLWSTPFGNPRCESVQDNRWKYIRYYANNNVSARRMERTAEEMDIPLNKLLYGVHDPQIEVYRGFIEGPLEGEPAVYEELYDLVQDPGEVTNLTDREEFSETLNIMRKVWKLKIHEARGKGKAAVERYTVESKSEKE